MKNNANPRVKITLKKVFCVSELDVVRDSDGDDLLFNDYNMALLQIIVGRRGKQVIGHLLEGSRVAIDGGAYGYDGDIIIERQFIDLEVGVEPLDNPFKKGLMYKMQDKDNVIGFFNGYGYNAKEDRMEASILTSSKEVVTGCMLVQLNDEDLEFFNFGLNEDYYA